MPSPNAWTAAAATAFALGALLACKKDAPPPPPVASAAPEPVATAEPAPAASAPAEKKDSVKRYDTETAESGTVRVAVHRLRVYSEADSGGAHIAELSQGTLVNRKARYGNWLLIDYPSGPGILSPGWVMATMTSTKVENVDPTAVANQDAGVAATASITAPPASTTAPPASTTAPPADTTAPPADTTAPPATTSAPPASTIVRPPRIIPPPPRGSPPRPGSQ